MHNLIARVRKSDILTDSTLRNLSKVITGRKSRINIQETAAKMEYC